MTLTHKKQVVHTLYDEGDREMSASWTEGQQWARFSSEEFQFTISREAVSTLHELCQAFLEAGGRHD